MELPNDIVLRPRFKIEIDRDNQSALETFETLKKQQSDFIVSRVDDHVFIRLPKHKQHFWSPQLHLEINKKDQKTSWLHGLYGPNPTVWTMFMFFHFLVAGVFIVMGIWAYTNWTLEQDYGLQVGLMGAMVVLWFVLYIAGRMGKRKGKPEMEQLCSFMKDTLAYQDKKPMTGICD
jgi:hypothetical protein